MLHVSKKKKSYNLINNSILKTKYDLNLKYIVLNLFVNNYQVGIHKTNFKYLYYCFVKVHKIISWHMQYRCKSSKFTQETYYH